MSVAPAAPQMALAAAALAAEVERRGIRFGAARGGGPLPVDPLPLAVEQDAWDELAAGVAQRSLALERLVIDLHGSQRCVADGVLPRAVVDGLGYLEHDLRGVDAPAVALGLAGPDVVRGPDGAWVVLEDNLRTPTMLAVALAVRAAHAAGLPGLGPPPAALWTPCAALLRDLVAAATPPRAADPAAPAGRRPGRPRHLRAALGARRVRSAARRGPRGRARRAVPAR